MGIPCFYKWLITKYPEVVASAVQEPTLDATSPNPNGIEFDNLYLDMNGIIHPCFHPDDLNELRPTSFEEVFNSVFEYVDRLFNIVRPRKLLYFAIDGVAPRAKMNQQRARRYQTAKAREISEQEEDRLRSQYARAGKELLPEAKSQVDDPNVISPGTEFTYEFSKALHGYIQTRLKENPAWKNLKVILSDSNVPGEGEHKIMSFIRSQRSLPDYDVNTRHCLHGLDADLIMLALATHEPHISILREVAPEVKQEQPLYNQTSIQDCKPFPVTKSCSYQFVHIWILKEYLQLDMQAFYAPESFQFDAERAVDDFVFICFFVGNDFLPHLPSLKIREGALELLMTVYKRNFKSLGGYLVDTERVNDPNGAYLNLERVEKFVLSLASYEDQILLKRTELSERKMRRVLNELCSSVSIQKHGARGMEIQIDIPNAENDDILKNTRQLKEELRRRLQDEGDVFKTGLFPDDKIKYGTPGWKERYYQEKFAFEDHLELESIKKAAVKYTEGLCWVLLYYFSGVPSWSWLYPYHYGPCASDLKGIAQLRVEFEQGFPFEPFDQLMAVLPPTSVQVLPKAYRKLMTDESSDLGPLYPREFKVDMYGKRHSWQGLCILPFIDETRLLRATRKAKEELTEYEAQRNKLSTDDLLYVRASSDFGSQLLSKIVQDPSGVNGVGGFVNLIVRALDSSDGEDRILCAHFSLPKPTIQAPRILDNVEYPPRSVYESDVEEAVLWHEQGGSRVRRAPNQLRYPGPQENEPSRLAGVGSGSREGLYNHPNWSKYVEHRASFRPQRPTPAPPRSRNNAWPSTSAAQMVGQYANLSVSSTPQGRGLGRGRGQYWPSRDSGSSEPW